MNLASRDRLDGRVAVITGGARGIGRATAEAFVSQGAAVMIADLGVGLDGVGPHGRIAADAAEQIDPAGEWCAGIDADVTDLAAAGRVIDATMDRFGGLDILVNVAGILRRGSILEVSRSDWKATLDVHVWGSIAMIQAAAQYWGASEGSHRRVINFSSDAGVLGDEDHLAYGIAKAGVIAMTMGCVEPLSRLGATCNTFIPQAETRMTASIPQEELPDSERWSTGEFAPENVTPALVYLASTESDWLSGRVVGGWGFEVHLYGGGGRRRSVFSPGPWELDDLFRRLPEAFQIAGP